ncbi:uncharacterized protein LOC132866795 [Neoarius graeffei]|uniref:uncharacterized protein LOC132866795 n=1 Tax=Neoarius graeffei TaxID=443677 RepID=UPI00298CE095|nr:uncharacterized protein LOC132866795 [Neoarius graeffei]
MLALLLFLTPIVSHCLVIPKCQLVEQLMSTVPEDVPSHENLVAKIVCRADETSQFDTSVVSQVSPQDLGRRKPRGVPKTLNHPKTITPIPMLHNSTEELNFNGTIRHVKRSVEGPWSLYGVFQLSDRVACASPNKPSLNLCNLSCDKLIDDDITDDISCVLTILKHKRTNPKGPADDDRFIKRMCDMIMDACPGLEYTEYLAECDGP